MDIVFYYVSSLRPTILISYVNNAKGVADLLEKIGADKFIIIACGTKQGATIEDLMRTDVP